MDKNISFYENEIDKEAGLLGVVKGLFAGGAKKAVTEVGEAAAKATTNATADTAIKAGTEAVKENKTLLQHYNNVGLGTKMLVGAGAGALASPDDRLGGAASGAALGFGAHSVGKAMAKPPKAPKVPEVPNASATSIDADELVKGAEISDSIDEMYIKQASEEMGLFNLDMKEAGEEMDVLTQIDELYKSANTLSEVGKLIKKPGTASGAAVGAAGGAIVGGVTGDNDNKGGSMLTGALMGAAGGAAGGHLAQKALKKTFKTGVAVGAGGTALAGAGAALGASKVIPKAVDAIKSGKMNEAVSKTRDFFEKHVGKDTVDSAVDAGKTLINNYKNKAKKVVDDVAGTTTGGIKPNGRTIYVDGEGVARKGSFDAKDVTPNRGTFYVDEAGTARRGKYAAVEYFEELIYKEAADEIEKTAAQRWMTEVRKMIAAGDEKGVRNFITKMEDSRNFRNPDYIKGKNRARSTGYDHYTKRVADEITDEELNPEDFIVKGRKSKYRTQPRYPLNRTLSQYRDELRNSGVSDMLKDGTSPIYSERMNNQLKIKGVRKEILDAKDKVTQVKAKAREKFGLGKKEASVGVFEELIYKEAGLIK